jgi:hypothetical protein
MSLFLVLAAGVMIAPSKIAIAAIAHGAPRYLCFRAATANDEACEPTIFRSRRTPPLGWRARSPLLPTSAGARSCTRPAVVIVGWHMLADVPHKIAYDVLLVILCCGQSENGHLCQLIGRAAQLLLEPTTHGICLN